MLISEHLTKNCKHYTIIGFNNEGLLIRRNQWLIKNERPLRGHVVTG